ncbi:unnamed protein product [Dicrocoelium dendriticum]|nr:unnamed protein product [Dicrocoelium dendriticum]
MFSCHYDGCDSESDSPSQDDELSAICNKQKAKAFEDAMCAELDDFVRGLNNLESEATEPRRVRFAPISGETEGGTEEVTEPTEDLLYDELEDDASEKWVKENLLGGRSRHSDAVLNCPCCMTVLAVNCRRDQRFKTLYRSSFPINCVVDESTRLAAPTDSQHRRKRRKNVSKSDESVHTNAPDEENSSDNVFAVNCDVCGILVGTKDPKTNVTTFSGTLASHT